MRFSVKLLDSVAKGFAIFAGMVLLLLVFLIFTDVFLRYLFSAPILGVEDTLQMGMVAVIFGSAPYVWRKAEHIVVDLLPEFKYARLRILRNLSIRLIIIGLMILLSWQAWIGADDAAFFGNATNMIEIPYEPFYWMIMVSSAFHAMIVFIEVFCICMGEEITIPPSDDTSVNEV
jgi:TRAP-type C4-dicarboxylate transport system permease small subunit